MLLAPYQEYQDRLEQHLEGLGLNVSYGDDLAVLLETYTVATGMDYVQLPFALQRAQDFSPYNFWVCFDDGNQPVALTGYRTMRNTDQPRCVGQAFGQGALYSPKEGSKEGWWADSGPVIAPQALYGYIGAGWVHPRFRGHNLAGFIARIAQVEAILRTKGTLSMSTAMTSQALFKSGMNLRASGLHHRHVEQVLEGYFQVTDSDMQLFLSHSTTAELVEFYDAELQMLRDGENIPWLQQPHDKSFAAAVLARMAETGATEVIDQPVSSMVALL